MTEAVVPFGFMDELYLKFDRKAKPGPDGTVRPWINLLPFRYNSKAASRIITVPSGFLSDFASTPRVPIIYEMFGNIAYEEAMLHDYLYTSGRESRATAVAVLREACELNGMPAWRRWGLWIGVRLGGGSHYTNPK